MSILRLSVEQGATKVWWPGARFSHKKFQAYTLSVFRHRWTKNGFMGPKCFRSFRGTGCRFQRSILCSFHGQLAPFLAGSNGLWRHWEQSAQIAANVIVTIGNKDSCPWQNLTLGGVFNKVLSYLIYYVTKAPSHLTLLIVVETRYQFKLCYVYFRYRSIPSTMCLSVTVASLKWHGYAWSWIACVTVSFLLLLFSTQLWWIRETIWLFQPKDTF